MRLTQWTDYTLRVLMYCAACQERATPVTITEISSAYNISRSHLTKVVFALGGQGWLTTTRGRGGGLRLARPAADFNLEEIVRATETDFTMVECFDAKTNQCGLTAHCILKGVLSEAMQNYFAVLQRYTLADLVRSPVTAGANAGANSGINAGLNAGVNARANSRVMTQIMLTPGIPLSRPSSPRGRAAKQSTPSSAPPKARARKRQP